MPALRDLTRPGALEAPERQRLERLCWRMRTLEEAMRLLVGMKPPAAIVEVITQDEFTHDVVFAMPEGHYLVFDTT